MSQSSHGNRFGFQQKKLFEAMNTMAAPRDPTKPDGKKRGYIVFERRV